MGVVWRARHVTLGREVALKRVIGSDAGDTTLQRFLREAQSAASVRAPNVVDVIDYGRDADGSPYLVMELLEGESLEQRLRRPPPVQLDEVFALVDQALAGLVAIHDAGIVHRDLKPANLFLAKLHGEARVVVKVLDFGIARPVAPEASALTHTMQTLGTPHYMSPEQVRSSRDVDARCDVYAMGVILYQVVTGRLPFEGPSATAIIAAIVTDDPPTVRSLRPEVPDAVAEVIQRAMSRRPDDRFHDARALREALVAAARGELPEAPRGVHLSAAPTVASGGSSVAGQTRDAGAPKASKAPTNRRGFFAIFGVLSTAGAAGLGLLATQAWQASPSADAVATLPAPPPGQLGGFDGPAAASPSAASPSAVSPIARGRAVQGEAAQGSAVSDGPVAGGTPPSATAAVPSVPEPTVPMLVGAPQTLSQVAAQWRALEPADRSQLTVRPSGEGWVLATTSEAVAGRVARALGTTSQREVSPVTAQSILTPRLFHANTRSNVRRGPSQDHALLATVMEGALVVGMVGTVEGEASGSEETEGWVRVFGSSAVEGWIARRLLDDEARCAPATSAFPAAEMLARAELREGRRVYDAFVGVEGRVVHIYETDTACHLSLRHSIRTDGTLADAFVTQITSGGESVVVLGEWPRSRLTADGRQRWTARLLSAPSDVVWSIELSSGQNLPDARRDGLGGPFSRGAGIDNFFPLRIRHPGQRVWLVWNEERQSFEPLPSERER